MVRHSIFRKTFNIITLLLLTICIAGIVDAKTLIKEKRVGKEQLPHQGTSALDSTAAKEPLSYASQRRGRFLLALGNDDIKEGARLLKQGIKVNQPFSESGQTALMLAQSLRMAKLLITHGAKADIKDVDKGSVLHYAVTQKSALELIPFFVSQGADINAEGWDSETPLLVAVTYFNEMGPSTTDPVFTGESSAASNSELPQTPRAQDVLELMVSLGSDLNAGDDHGFTALMQCTTADNDELVKLLLKLGADKNIRDKYGDRAIDIAKKMGHRFIYQLLE
jgi:ankyrin repeat protein